MTDFWDDITEIDLDMYFLILLESGGICHFNGAWIGMDFEYKKSVITMIELAYLKQFRHNDRNS